MDHEEMMDDDLFADLYGDDEPSKSAPKKAPETQKADAPKTLGLPVPLPTPTASAPETTNAPEEQPVNESGNDDDRAQQNTFSNDGMNGQFSFNQNDGASGGAHDAAMGGFGMMGGAGHGDQGEHDTSPAIKEDGKMFIGGLNWETTDESLREYFSQFGEVVECTVMRDGSTGRSRGFGFLTFKDAKTVNIVMVKEHYLDGKIIDPKRAIPRDEQERTSKIFVGGVSQEVSEADFREFFSQFGRIVDATLMMDKDTGRPRGFGFVTFENESAVEAALAVPDMRLGDKTIEVKKAQPRGNVRDRHFDEDGSGGGGGGASGGNFNRDNRGGGGGGGNFRDRGHRGDRFDRNNQDNFGNNQNQQGNNAMSMPGGNAGAAGGIYNGMTPQGMAQFWQRMQQYWAVMQANMGRGRGDGQTPPQMMNPAMMAQMMAMQQQGGANPAMMNNMNMNPAMMAQMQQMQQMQMQQQMQQQQMQQGGGSGSMQGGTGQGGFNNAGQGGFNMQGQGGGFNPQMQQGPPNAQQAQQQQQQRHQQQQMFGQQNAQQGQMGGNQWGGGGSGSSGAYDETNGSGQGQGSQGNDRAVHSPGQQFQSMAGGQQQQPGGPQKTMSPIPGAPTGPSRPTSSGPPPNAPTGPRNSRPQAPTGPSAGTSGPGPYRSGRGGSGFNKGGSFGNQRGFHPYNRNSGNQNQNQNQNSERY